MGAVMAGRRRRRGGFFNIFKRGNLGLHNLHAIATDPFMNFKKRPVTGGRRRYRAKVRYTPY